MAAMTFAAQCAAKTEGGVQCKRKAQPGKKYCWQHANYKPEAKKGEVKKPSAKKPTVKSADKAPAKQAEKPAAK